MNILFYGVVFLIILGFAGMVDTYYLYCHKKKNIVLACRIGHKCGSVVTSKYATTFGFDNVYLGMIYYTGIFLVNVLTLINLPIPIGLMLLASSIGFCFSWYLIYIMKFVLKEWCDWCLASATISNLIFFTYLALYITTS